VYELDGAELASTSSIESGSGYKCSSFGAASISEPCLAVGGFDGKLQLWDLEAPRVPLWDTQAHSGIVNGMDAFGGQVCV
jgi:WD40 repeat protein